MPKKDYEIIEHTADVGIRVRADDLAGLFSKAACAMFDIIAEKKTEEKFPLSTPFTKGGNKGLPLLKGRRGDFQVNLKAENLEELFVDWLSELLYLYSVKELVFGDFKINKIDETSIEAVVFGEAIINYKVKTEIKAVTYHELEVKKIGSGWEGKVIFDV